MTENTEKTDPAEPPLFPRSLWTKHGDTHVHQLLRVPGRSLTGPRRVVTREALSRGAALYRQVFWITASTLKAVL